MRGMEFGGFSSWASFTEHCCCMPRTQAAHRPSSLARVRVSQP